MNRKQRTLTTTVAVAALGIGGIATAYALPSSSDAPESAPVVAEAPVAPSIDTAATAAPVAPSVDTAAVEAQAAAEAAYVAEVAANMQAQAAVAEAQAAVEAQAAAEAAYVAEVAANMQAQAAATPAPAVESASSAGAASGDVAAWASSEKAMSVKFCESTNNYSTNTGNGYYGAWQFDLPSWLANGGGAYAPRPDLAPAWAQDQVAYNYYQVAGWGPWECA